MNFHSSLSHTNSRKKGSNSLENVATDTFSDSQSSRTNFNSGIPNCSFRQVLCIVQDLPWKCDFRTNKARAYWFVRKTHFHDKSWTNLIYKTWHNQQFWIQIEVRPRWLTSNREPIFNLSVATIKPNWFSMPNKVISKFLTFRHIFPFNFIRISCWQDLSYTNFNLMCV